MRVLVLSDNHGNLPVLEAIVQRERVHHLIHCGDFCAPVSRLPMPEQSTVVKGNCDTEPAPDELLWEGKRFRFFVTHGHRYRVNSGLTYLSYRADEVQAHIVCFGHTHYPLCMESGGRLYVNPGSVVQPRGYDAPTYALMELESNRADVSFFTTDGVPVPELKATFSI